MSKPITLTGGGPLRLAGDSRPSERVTDAPTPGCGPEMLAFNHRVSVGSAIVDRIRQRLGLWLFRRSLPLFVRGGDSISLDPLVNGHWDYVVQGLIRQACDAGYADFFIDIGANIGLTSCQCGDRFRQVLMFEPNPEIFPILELNAKLALRSGNTQAFNFGLGPCNAETVLNIPSENFGGAFVHDENNAYSDALFASRLGRDLHGLRQVPAQIRSVAEVLPPLFDELRANRCTKGVIKLDVEGYERTILEAMAAHLPRDFRFVVVFENWRADLDIEALLRGFERPVHAFRIRRFPAARGALWKDLPSMLLTGGYRFELAPIVSGDCEGEIVLQVQECA